MNSKINSEIIKLALELYNELGNIKKVAKILHISYDTLRNYIMSNKITPKKRDTSKYRKNVKELLILYKGGKCLICGYNRCTLALDFHHLDPKEKELKISGGTRCFETLKKEVDKCILVCANCHREIHANIINIPIDLL